MKTREGFVSNSSSTSFVIYNNTDKTLPLAEFVRENLHLVDLFNNRYLYSFSHPDVLEAVSEYDYNLRPGENICTFGDDDGNPLGHIYDYILRDGGHSERFSWDYRNSNR